jgi:hypothetical protein
MSTNSFSSRRFCYSLILSLHLCPSTHQLKALPLPTAQPDLQHKQQTRHNTHNTQPNPQIHGISIPHVLILLRERPAIRMRLHGARDPDADTDTVIHDGVDHAGRHALVFLLDGIAHDQRAGGETHVHAPGDDEDNDKGLRPVGLVRRHCGDEDAARHEGEHADHHYPAGTRPSDYLSSRDSCE